MLAAFGVVVQLKQASNTIWETKSRKGAGIWWYTVPISSPLPAYSGRFLLAVSLVICPVQSAVS
jgi:hypothetical protein